MIGEMSEDKLLRHELIGLKVAVICSSNILHSKIKGIVLDESKNTLVIADDFKKKRLPKEGVRYGFTTSDGKLIEIEGNQILNRPADRISKASRRKRS